MGVGFGLANTTPPAAGSRSHSKPQPPFGSALEQYGPSVPSSPSLRDFTLLPAAPPGRSPFQSALFSLISSRHSNNIATGRARLKSEQRERGGVGEGVEPLASGAGRGGPAPLSSPSLTTSGAFSYSGAVGRGRAVPGRAGPDWLRASFQRVARYGFHPSSPSHPQPPPPTPCVPEWTDGLTDTASDPVASPTDADIRRPPPPGGAGRGGHQAPGSS